MSESFTMDAAYTMRSRIPLSGCDIFGRAGLSYLLRCAIDIAGFHYASIGLSHETLRSQGAAFLLSRLEMNFEASPCVDDDIVISTREEGAKGAFLIRSCDISKDGTRLVSISSAWLIVNPDTRTIIRPSLFTQRRYGKCTEARRTGCCTRLRAPDRPPDRTGSHIVSFSELDCNGHMNSACYGDVAVDFLPDALQDARIRRFTINYEKEARRGELLTLSGFASDGDYIISALHDGQTCFTVRFSF